MVLFRNRFLTKMIFTTLFLYFIRRCSTNDVFKDIHSLCDHQALAENKWQTLGPIKGSNELKFIFKVSAFRHRKLRLGSKDLPRAM